MVATEIKPSTWSGRMSAGSGATQASQRCVYSDGQRVEEQGGAKGEQPGAEWLEYNAAEHGGDHEEELVSEIVSIDHDRQQGSAVDPEDQQGFGPGRLALAEQEQGRQEEGGDAEVDGGRQAIPKTEKRVP